MPNIELNHSNFEIFAAQHYRNKRCLSAEEFYDDLAKIKYVKRLLRRYRETGDIKIRLVLNHIIAFFNVFEIRAGAKMFFYSMDVDLWPTLKTFLVFGHYLEECEFTNVGIDIKIAHELRRL